LTVEQLLHTAQSEAPAITQLLHWMLPQLQLEVQLPLAQLLQFGQLPLEQLPSMLR
jgi:hypothetical protein